MFSEQLLTKLISFGVSPQSILLITVGEEDSQEIPPPKYLDKLLLMVQLIIVGEEPKQEIPPPLLLDELPLMMQLIIVGEE